MKVYVVVKTVENKIEDIRVFSNSEEAKSFIKSIEVYFKEYEEDEILEYENGNGFGVEEYDVTIWETKLDAVLGDTKPFKY